jgi:hypothetical protein
MEQGKINYVYNVKKFNNFTSVFSVVALGLLLLVSPCKVRNFIQAELGVEQTQVSNKSQSFVPQFNCQHLEHAEANALISKTGLEFTSYAGSLNFNVNLDTISHRSLVVKHDTSSKVASSVPLYILYNHLKVDL